MLSINVPNASTPNAFPSPLSSASADATSAVMSRYSEKEGADTSVMLNGASSNFDYGLNNFLSFDMPGSTAMSSSTLPSIKSDSTFAASMFRPIGGFFDSASAAVSPCTAMITQAAVAAMEQTSRTATPQSIASSTTTLPTPVSHAPDLDTTTSLNLPTDFYLPSFQEYDRRQYDLATNPEMRRHARMHSLASSLSGFINKTELNGEDGSGDDEFDAMDMMPGRNGMHPGMSTPTSIPPALLAAASHLDPSKQAELRRQIHIQSEQKRRAQIKDGFEDLRKQLPNCVSKKLSKAVILARTTVYLQQLKQHAMSLQNESDRLANENARLKRMLADNGISVPNSGKMLDAMFPMPM